MKNNDQTTGVQILQAEKEYVVLCKAPGCECEHQVPQLLADALGGTVQGSVQPPRGVLQDYLYHDKRKGKAYAVKSLRKGVKQAELEYKTLAEAAQNGETISLVWVRLHTGRFHQIRAQFAARKMPLLGDGRYGSREKGCGTALFSCGVGFAAPAGGKEVLVRQTPPRAFPWNVFAEALYDL